VRSENRLPGTGTPRLGPQYGMVLLCGGVIPQSTPKDDGIKSADNQIQIEYT